MKSSDQFAAYAVEILSAVGRVAARRMFGGYGVYCDGTMFALVADDVLYLKVDDGNRGEFERAVGRRLCRRATIHSHVGAAAVHSREGVGERRKRWEYVWRRGACGSNVRAARIPASMS
jgi:hypothetical protein